MKTTQKVSVSSVFIRVVILTALTLVSTPVRAETFGVEEQKYSKEAAAKATVVVTSEKDLEVLLAGDTPNFDTRGIFWTLKDGKIVAPGPGFKNTKLGIDQFAFFTNVNPQKAKQIDHDFRHLHSNAMEVKLGEEIFSDVESGEFIYASAVSGKTIYLTRASSGSGDRIAETYPLEEGKTIYIVSRASKGATILGFNESYRIQLKEVRADGSHLISLQIVKNEG